MSLFGYDPLRFHTGRAPIEAAAQGLTLEQFEQQMAEQMKANKPEPAPDVN